MKIPAYILTLLLSTIYLNAQDVKFRANIDKDSLFNASIERLPIEMREEYTKIFKVGDEQVKDFYCL